MEKTLDLNVVKYDTLEDWVVSMDCEYKENEDYLAQIEAEHPDMSFTNDVDLGSLIDDLLYNDLTGEMIETRNAARYGAVIDLYQIDTGNDRFFIMGTGQR